MIKVKYTLKEVKPKIFLAEFEDIYDMAMTFCRYQEFYESPNPKFRNKSFTMAEFTQWYSKTQGNGAFLYPKHWIGYNLPSKVLYKCMDSLPGYYNQDDDHNQYDTIMDEIVLKIENKLSNQNNDFYLIGAQKGNERTVHHEVAHAMFYLNKKYRKEMTALVKELKPTFKNKFFKDLTKIGYTKQVLIDEAQAFLSTGWRDFFTPLKGQDKTFIEVFNRYYNE